jgi:O-antigen/teichoic acid export membrane protein
MPGSGGIEQKARWDLFYRLGAVACSMVYGILISRFLGAEGRGTFVMQSLLVQGLCLTFLNPGLGVAFQTICARKPGALRVCHRWALVSAGSLALLATAFFLPLGLMGTGGLVVVVGAGFFATLYQAFAGGLLNGLGRVVERARLEFLQSALLAGFAFSQWGTGETSVGITLLGFYGVMGVSALLFFRLVYPEHRGGLKGTLKRRHFNELLGYGMRVYAGEVAASSRFQLDQVVISSVFGAAGLGIYQQAQALATRGLMPSQSYSTALWKPMGQAGTEEQASLMLWTTLRRVFLISLVVLVVGWVCAPLIPVIYGSDFVDAVGVFRILLPGVLLQGAVQVIAVWMFAHRRAPARVAVLNWLSLGIQGLLMAMAWLVWPSLTGFAVALSVAWCFTAVLFFVGMRSKVQFK